MSASQTLKAAVRQKVGSRDARKLRAAGRLPASLQTDGEDKQVVLHVDYVEFISSRRHHVHLYDLDIEGVGVEAAVVRELQYDALGDSVIHVDFKHVERGVATESDVEISVFGHVKEGMLSMTHNVIRISSIPSLIPDSIEINVNDLEVGTHIVASDLVLPEGVSLAVPDDFEVAVVSAPRREVEEEVAADELDPTLPAEEPKTEADGEESTDEDG